VRPFKVNRRIARTFSALAEDVKSPTPGSLAS
jgi:hypothetical protein